MLGRATPLQAQQEAETSKTGLDPSNDAGPSGTGGAAAGAMPEMPPEAQPGYHEPPSQRPPMWHPQVIRRRRRAASSGASDAATLHQWLG